MTIGSGKAALGIPKRWRREPSQRTGQPPRSACSWANTARLAVASMKLVPAIGIGGSPAAASGVRADIFCMRWNLRRMSMKGNALPPELQGLDVDAGEHVRRHERK